VRHQTNGRGRDEEGVAHFVFPLEGGSHHKLSRATNVPNLRVSALSRLSSFKLDSDSRTDAARAQLCGSVVHVGELQLELRSAFTLAPQQGTLNRMARCPCRNHPCLERK
jgi:hypothetical protein